VSSRIWDRIQRRGLILRPDSWDICSRAWFPAKLLWFFRVFIDLGADFFRCSEGRARRVSGTAKTLV